MSLETIAIIILVVVLLGVLLLYLGMSICLASVVVDAAKEALDEHKSRQEKP